MAGHIIIIRTLHIIIMYIHMGGVDTVLIIEVATKSLNTGNDKDPTTYRMHID